MTGGDHPNADTATGTPQYCMLKLHNTAQTPQYWADTSILCVSILCAGIAVHGDTDGDSRKGEEAGLPLTTPHCTYLTQNSAIIVQ